MFQNKNHTQKIQVQRRAHQKAQKKENNAVQAVQTRAVWTGLCSYGRCSQFPLASSQVILNTDAVDLSSYCNYSNKTRKKPITIKSCLHRLSEFIPLGFLCLYLYFISFSFLFSLFILLSYITFQPHFLSLHYFQLSLPSPPDPFLLCFPSENRPPRDINPMP